MSQVSLQDTLTKNKLQFNKAETVEKGQDAKETKGFNFQTLMGDPKSANKNALLNNMLDQSANDQLVMSQKILLQQLKNQFPGNEFDADKMVESLMSMMQIAQNSQLNETQQKSFSLLQAGINAQFADLQGKFVEHTGNEFDFQGTPQEISFALPENAASTTVSVYSKKDGSLIHQEKIVGLAGNNHYSWNGLLGDGLMAPKENYKIYVAALDKDEAPIETNVQLRSEVTEIVYDEGAFGIPYSGSIPIYNLNRLTSSKKIVEQFQKNPAVFNNANIN